MIDFEQIFAQEQAENPSRQIHAQTNVGRHWNNDCQRIVYIIEFE